MQPWVWIVVTVVVLALIALALRAGTKQRRSAALRDRFGPEYDRVVERSDDRRAAEQHLAERADKRDRLHVVPLPEVSRRQYTQEWRGVQERFVDDPSGAVTSAQALVDRVMSERGYPVRSFDEQAELVSVDHPSVVENYRAAHGTFLRHRNGQAGTEELREALVRYRSLFDELLLPGDDGRTDVRANGRADAPAEARTADEPHGRHIDVRDARDGEPTPVTPSNQRGDLR